ncbi:unnamed protein product, partial [Mesorhabditis belari]|uniref:C2H2-type domain-containing protein n=1 Tax=Mesorhabditis belari TaxID=2138241 RepID=A0AAF3F4E0_9BILA
MNGLLVDDRPLVFDDLEKDQVVRQTTPIRNSPHKRKNESMAESYIEEVDELEFCSMENDEDRLAARFNVHTKSFKQRECKICSETVNAMSAHSMLVHMGKHDREAIRWECERCDFRSQSEIKVTKHIHSLHKGQGSPIDRRIKKNLDKYWISLVKECFPTRKSVIKSHIEELTKKKLCNEKMLSDRSRLFDHIAQHCWRRSYECTHCEAKFSARNQATDHLRRSHQKQAQLVEIIDRELIDVWRSMGEQCFPEETDKIEHCINQRFRLLKLQGVSFANLSYELILTPEAVGIVSADGNATGLLGELKNEEWDVICARMVMSPERRKFFHFSFPSQYEVTQVFMIRDDSLPVFLDSFLFRPFTLQVWLALLGTFLLINFLYILFRCFEFGRIESKTSTFINATYTVLWTITENTYGSTNTGYHSRYYSVRFFTVFWIMIFLRIFVDYYGSNLRKILIFSDNIQLPFTDFRGFLEVLRNGEYHLLTSTSTSLPVCPFEYFDHCEAIFQEIFTKFPPIIGPYQQLANEQFIKKFSHPLVAFAWLPGQRITSDYSILSDQKYDSHVWVIRNQNIFPASFIMNKRIPWKILKKIDKAVVALQGALETVDRHYDPTYPQVSLQQVPTKTAFTLRQLSVIFYVLLENIG